MIENKNDIVYPALSKSIYIKEFKDKRDKVFLVLDPDLPSWVLVNEDSIEILTLCDGNNSLKDISQQIAERHGLEYNDSLLLTHSFLDEMVKKKILNDTHPQTSSKNQFRGIALEITNKCNLRCTHCYLSAGSSNKTDLTLAEIKKVLKSVRELGGTSVAIGGGEPLVREDCIEILRYAESLDLLISLGTNGTLIDRKLAKLLSEIELKIQVSLDGASKETHDLVRGEGSYELAIKGIDNLIAEGMQDDILIAFTPMKINIHEINEIIDLTQNLGISVIQFPPLSPSGRAREKWNKLKLSDKETLRFWNFLHKKAEKLRGKMDLLADCFSLNINTLGTPFRCTIGTQLRIDPEGYVYPCQCFHFGNTYCLGNIREQSLKKIVLGNRLNGIMEECFERPLKIDECMGCEWKNYCGSGCMGLAFENNGDVLHPESCEIRKKWVENLFLIEAKKIMTNK
jgi:radical SAM protein with 4Fe4S-binding SPASM domain